MVSAAVVAVVIIGKGVLWHWGFGAEKQKLC